MLKELFSKYFIMKKIKSKSISPELNIIHQINEKDEELKRLENEIFSFNKMLDNIENDRSKVSEDDNSSTMQLLSDAEKRVVTKIKRCRYEIELLDFQIMKLNEQLIALKNEKGSDKE